jgi:hypothetical protein
LPINEDFVQLQAWNGDSYGNVMMMMELLLLACPIVQKSEAQSPRPTEQRENVDHQKASRCKIIILLKQVKEKERYT